MKLVGLFVLPLALAAVEIPVGTYLEARLTSPVSTATSRAQDTFKRC